MMASSISGGAGGSARAPGLAGTAARPTELRWEQLTEAITGVLDARKDRAES